jgi:UDP-glucose 4-epimerase/UDP-glucuronate decarboxylase
MPQKDVVSGAAGLIGFEVTAQLLRRGGRVIAIDDFRKGGRAELDALQREFPRQLDIVELDLADGSLSMLPSGRMARVFHLAAIVGVDYVNRHPYETLRVNTLSTVRLFDWAIAHGCDALLFASSSENYASAVDRGWVTLPTAEDVPLCISDIALPRWSYAASKIAGESAVFGAAAAGGFRGCVMRFHNVYGPRMGPTHVIPEFLDRCRRRIDPFPIYGYDATRSFLHVADAATAICLVADTVERTDGGIFNIGSADEVLIGDLADLVFDVTGFHPRVEAHDAPPGSVRRRLPDISRLRALGFAPTVALRAGIASCWNHAAYAPA